MNAHIQTALSELDCLGITYDPASLHLYGTQGIMSEVYILTTSVGELVVHIKKITPEQRAFGMPDKLKIVSDATRAFPHLPLAEVLSCVDLSDHAVTIQHKLPGHAAGSIELRGNTTYMEWKEPVETVGPQVEAALAAIHAQVPTEGFGVIESFADGRIHARYQSWKEFLMTEAPLWADAIAQKSLVTNPEDDMRPLFAQLFDRLFPLITYTGPSSLVCTDYINPSNVLMSDGKLSGLIDWEWALLADPAWDFTYCSPYSLTTYFSEQGITSKEAQDDFRMRIRVCEMFVLLMWAYGTSNDPRSSLFIACKERIAPAVERFLADFN
ncbi:aminoglycoside phosphotransferase family protein [Patescibacteria group bacterium]|nr:aminoglycoside phosphotransferase family protein [Patescibacteria group bacterium]